MADIRYETINTEQPDLLSVLLALKENIMIELNVATIGKVRSIEGQTAKVQLYPAIKNEQPQTIYSIISSNLDVNVNDIVVVLYLDRNFISALKKLKQNQNPSSISDDVILHSKEYGIIISVL